MGRGAGSAGERPSAAKHEAHSSVSTMLNRQLEAEFGVVAEPCGGLEGLRFQRQEVLILEQARHQVMSLGPAAEICDGGISVLCGCGVGARATLFVPGGLREVGLREVRVWQLRQIYILTSSDPQLQLPRDRSERSSRAASV